MSENEMTGNLTFFVNAKNAEAEVSAEKRAEVRLIERVCAGETEAFDELYQIFAPLVHGILLARLPHDEVSDVAQEVFLSAYKNLHTLRDKNACGAWLAKIARNRASEFYRQSKSTEELSENLPSRENPKNEAREILGAIRALPETYRETLILRLVEGMTGAEIAGKTGLTPESVRVNLHRGMKLLRRKLGIEE